MAHVVVTNTGQDMFCPGIAMLPDGRIAVFGGHFDAARISVYDAVSNHWTPARPMALTRGYESAVTQADGSVFVIGGSWGDQDTVKNGEVWKASTGSTLLAHAPVAPMLTSDREGMYRADNHGWLFTWGTRVFQAGPSKAMNWYSSRSGSSVTPAGLRGDDGDAMNGAAVMYSPGKILTLGGAEDYTGTPATAAAHVVSITGGKAFVSTVAPMHFARSFASAVVLPDGKVFVSGGMAFPKTFSDATAVMTPELWDPATRTFSDMADMQVPRTYHSEAVLLPDGRVLVGGGGLCGLIEDCVDANHADAQIWSPPYLFNPTGTPASRPMITAAPTSSYAGRTIVVRTNTTIGRMVLVRASAVTHSVNTDQRRLPVSFTGTPARGYNVTLPADRGVLVPGAYMLFALNPKGVPSVAKIITIR
jgi:galactose oxidase